MARNQTPLPRVLIGAALVCIVLCAPLTLHSAPPPGKSGNRLSRQQAAQAVKDLPLVFEPNLGQTGPQVRFLTRAAGITSFFTSRENVMVLSWRNGRPEAPEIERAMVRMRLDGATLPLCFEAEEKAESISHYFIGNDPSRWTPTCLTIVSCAHTEFTPVST